MKKWALINVSGSMVTMITKGFFVGLITDLSWALMILFGLLMLMDKGGAFE